MTEQFGKQRPTRLESPMGDATAGGDPVNFERQIFERSIKNHAFQVWDRLEKLGDSPDDLKAAYKTFDTLNPLVVADQLIRVHFMQMLSARFAVESLDTLQAFMLSEDGHRRIIVEEDMDPARRVFYYFHLAGHLASGHIPSTELDIRFEIPTRKDLPEPRLLQENQADEWALNATGKPLNPQNPLTNAVRNAVVTISEELKGTTSPK